MGAGASSGRGAKQTLSLRPGGRLLGQAQAGHPKMLGQAVAVRNC